MQAIEWVVITAILLDTTLQTYQFHHYSNGFMASRQALKLILRVVT